MHDGRSRACVPCDFEDIAAASNAAFPWIADLQKAKSNEGLNIFLEIA